MNKDLKYFMRENKEEIVTVPGPESFKDENGNVINFEIKVLPQSEIMRINEKYNRKSIATDKKGNPLISNGEVVFRTEKDGAKATRHIIVEALQYPNLKDPELMDFYKCHDITEMPLKVFPKTDEYTKVINIVFAALGIGDFGEEPNDDEEVEDAKN